jgi:hypothetical protein
VTDTPTSKALKRRALALLGFPEYDETYTDGLQVRRGSAAWVVASSVASCDVSLVSRCWWSRSVRVSRARRAGCVRAAAAAGRARVVVPRQAGSCGTRHRDTRRRRWTGGGCAARVRDPRRRCSRTLVLHAAVLASFGGGGGARRVGRARARAGTTKRSTAAARVALGGGRRSAGVTVQRVAGLHCAHGLPGGKEAESISDQIENRVSKGTAEERSARSIIMPISSLAKRSGRRDGATKRITYGTLVRTRLRTSLCFFLARP